MWALFPTRTLVLFSWQPLLSSRPFVYWKREGEARSGGRKGWLGGTKGWELNLKGWFHERDCWCVDVGTAEPLWCNQAGGTEGYPRRCLNVGMEHWVLRVPFPQHSLQVPHSHPAEHQEWLLLAESLCCRQATPGKAAQSHSALPGDTSSLNQMLKYKCVNIPPHTLGAVGLNCLFIPV